MEVEEPFRQSFRGLKTDIVRFLTEGYNKNCLLSNKIQQTLVKKNRSVYMNTYSLTFKSSQKGFYNVPK